MYTIIVLALVLWGICLHVLFSVAPGSVSGKFTFLIPLFLALTATISIPMYFFFFNKAPTFTNLKLLYRRSLKWALFFSFGLSVIVGLKIFGVFTIINVILFCILYFAVYMQLRSSK